MHIRLLAPAVFLAALSACGDAVSTGPDESAHFDWFGSADAGACGIRDGAGWCAGWIEGEYAQVLGGAPVREFGFGWDHVCALPESGNIECWLTWNGDWPSGFPQPRPPESEPAPRFTALAIQRERGCALDADGGIWCWGYHYPRGGIFGWPVADLPEWCYGYGRTCDFAAQMPAPVRFSAFGLGQAHGCGLAGNEIWCWGDTTTGALGRGGGESAIECSEDTCGFPPRRIAAAAEFEYLAVTHGGGCGLTAAGRAWCWGAGGASPMPVPGTFEVITGGTQACGLANRIVYCWVPAGDGHTVADSSAVTPQPVPEFLFDRLFPSLGSSCGANRVNGAVCWGGNSMPRIIPGQRPT